MHNFGGSPVLYTYHVLGNGGPYCLAISAHEVDGTGREARLLNQLTHFEGVKRCGFGAFDDDCVPCRESWCDLPCEPVVWTLC